MPFWRRIFFASASAFGLSGSQMTPASDAASTARCKRAAFEYQKPTSAANAAIANNGIARNNVKIAT